MGSIELECLAAILGTQCKQGRWQVQKVHYDHKCRSFDEDSCEPGAQCSYEQLAQRLCDNEA
jgi:hypothetical protein